MYHNTNLWRLHHLRFTFWLVSWRKSAFFHVFNNVHLDSKRVSILVLEAVFHHWQWLGSEMGRERGWAERGDGQREGMGRGRGWAEGGDGQREGMGRGRGWAEGGDGQREGWAEEGMGRGRRWAERGDGQREEMGRERGWAEGGGEVGNHTRSVSSALKCCTASSFLYCPLSRSNSFCCSVRVRCTSFSLSRRLVSTLFCLLGINVSHLKSVKREWGTVG